MIKPARKRKTVVVFCGLGTIGLQAASYASNFVHCKVYGFDISAEAVKKARCRGISAETCFESLPRPDIYVICVSTGLQGPNPDMSKIFDAGSRIKKHLDGKWRPLVVIESTVSVGTCRRLYQFLDRDVNVIHVPHRYWPFDNANYGVRQQRILGAIDETSRMNGTIFYSSIDIPVRNVSTLEVAEMSKIAENSYRFVEIAFAEQLRMICDKFGIDFEQVRSASNGLVRNSAKEKWKVQILEAKTGIGGTCLPKDIRYLLSLDENSSLLRAVIETDQLYKDTRQGSLIMIAPEA